MLLASLATCHRFKILVVNQLTFLRILVKIFAKLNDCDRVKTLHDWEKSPLSLEERVIWISIRSEQVPAKVGLRLHESVHRKSDKEGVDCQDNDLADV